MGSAVRCRRALEADLDACVQIFRAANDDYQGRLNLPALPDDLAHMRRLIAHLLATDPDRFWVASTRGSGVVDGVVDGTGVEVVAGAEPERLVGFGSATVRDGLWFLGLLFVDPRVQGAGIGQALLDHVQAGRDVDPGGPAIPGPDDPLDSGIHTWGMCTDAAQPISNGLYARRGMIPRIPIWRLSGEVRRPSALPALPASLAVEPFDALSRMAGGNERLAVMLDAFDRELLGIAHPADHAWLHREGRIGFLVRERSGRVLGYGYGSGLGRLGPVAALDPALHPGLLGIAVRESPSLGPVAAWVPGTASEAVRALLDAGLRIDGMPGMICWSRDEHPFRRYLPSTLALL